MKKLATLLLTTYILVLSAHPIFAVDSLDTPVGSASAIKEDINKRIKEAIDKNLKNTQAVLSESSDQIVGYVGIVSDIKQGVFNLNTDTIALQVSLGSATQIIKDNQPLKTELISLKDKAIVIGNLSSPDILTAKRIVIIKEIAPKSEKKVVLSTIVKVDLKKKTITLKIDDKALEMTMGKLIKFDLATLKLTQKIFGIIVIDTASGGTTLIQGKII
ncbi:hypothetical protein A3A84_02480 [Candidatus Collierbacteria bacterium RIFCSPLOWO2_01_FULL_50_23]|uniref:DUF5666 domain-containing protein n=2 Tax=Candidatus Collieribacteriota TaxID=1752725 RepID=A0A1F5ETI9_9BACT|nr:MAG: hypothetical protein A3D09_00940 [Candidatus Collierbacteria bacterium RIFCSPHIGHO2_02_FULL_49_10]OGD72254.1 MAG: hypothetical protein A2703_02720 [Candidatus Collierbacteria bacterium RIFCSPHIGHO2_01_FULL_50_25]OGD73823.1 MAG: hypothetical protein A3A84_02480 [Candidatus Collierbacteria bacterium RIFCSPLOWO2_01_FULL_50_23]